MLNVPATQREIEALIGKYGENMDMIASHLAAKQFDDADGDGDEHVVLGGGGGGGGGSSFGGGFTF